MYEAGGVARPRGFGTPLRWRRDGSQLHPLGVVNIVTHAPSIFQLSKYSLFTLYLFFANLETSFFGASCAQTSSP
jgi:hypothetical protein